MSESHNAIAVRAALMQTVKSSGWAYVKELTVKIRANAIQEALDEDNPVLGEAKRLKAKALQSGFNDLFAEIEKRIASPDADDQPERFENLSAFEESVNGR